MISFDKVDDLFFALFIESRTFLLYLYLFYGDTSFLMHKARPVPRGEAERRQLKKA